jgi:hypothetical protein
MPNTKDSKLNFIYDFDKSALASFKFNMSKVDNHNNKNNQSCQIIAKEAISIISFNDFSIHACYVSADDIFAYSGNKLALISNYVTNDTFFVYTHGSISFITNNGASLSSFGINKPTGFSDKMIFRPLKGDDNLVITHTDDLYIYTTNPTDFLHNVNFNKDEGVYIYIILIRAMNVV